MYQINEVLDELGIVHRSLIVAQEPFITRFVTQGKTSRNDCLILSLEKFQLPRAHHIPKAGAYLLISRQLPEKITLPEVVLNNNAAIYHAATEKNVNDLAKLLTQASEALCNRQKQLLTSQYQALIALLSKEADMDEIAAFAYKLLGNPMIITDESYKVLTHTHELKVEDPVWETIVTHTYSTAKLVEQTDVNHFWERLEQSTLPLFVDDQAFAGLAKRAVAKIRIGSQTKGYIALLEIEKPITQLDLNILQTVSEVLSVKINETDNMQRVTGQLRDDFTGNLLSGNISSLQMAENYARSLKLQFGQWSCVLCVQAADERDIIAGDLACLRTKLLTKSALAIYTSKGSQGYYILSFKDKKQMEQMLTMHLEQLLTEFKLLGILSLPTEVVTDLHEGYVQVEKIRSILPKIADPMRNIYPYAAFASLEIVASLVEKREEITSRAYRTLQQVDEMEDTHYLETLRAFFASNQNVSETASKLYLHRNTVNYRLNRIKKILEDDFDDPLIRLHLYLNILASKLH